MGQTVYVDLFFMINFSMDFLCFFLASQLLGSRMRLMRTVLASAIGGIYANVALFLSLGAVLSIMLDVAVCALMCLVAFGKSRSLIVHTLVYIAVSMTLGGFMTALFELLNRMELGLESTESDGISAWVLALLAIVSGALALASGRFFRRKSARRYTKVSVELDGKKITLNAFCDSGNLLRDPVSSKPCILTSAEALGSILPRALIEASRSGGTQGLDCAYGNLARRIRLIPVRTAVGEGCLIGLRADRISVGEGKSYGEVDALIALTDTKEFGEGCEALLPTELLI